MLYQNEFKSGNYYSAYAILEFEFNTYFLATENVSSPKHGLLWLL